MWRRKRDEPTPRVDPERPPCAVLSEGEILWSQDNETHLPIQVVAYVTETKAQREAASSLPDWEYSDAMIYRQPNGRWIGSSRQYMATTKAEAVEQARERLAQEYAALNARRAEIDAIEETF